MPKRPKSSIILAIPAILAAIFVVFAASQFVKQSAELRAENFRRELENGAALCFALNGFYPPDEDFLTKQFNFSTDRNKYTISYQYDENSPNPPKIEVQLR